MERFFTIVICLIFSFGGFSAFGEDSIFLSAISSISPENIRTHLEVLGSDSLQGRGTGQPGGELAAEYLASRFKKLGIVPVCNGRSYFQDVPMHGNKPLSDSEMRLFTEKGNYDFQLWDDYLLYKSGDQTYTPKPLPVVFAGFGISAPEFDYNDYQSIDVSGKIVAFLDGEPYSEDKNYFDGNQPSVYRYPESKIRMALAHGAAGCIFIPNMAENPMLLWEKLQLQFAFEDVTLAYTASAGLALLLNPLSAQRLFIGSEYSLNDIFSMYVEKGIKSFPLETRLSFKGTFKRRDFISRNVIGMIPGSDPELKDSYLLVSAHYDHLGIGPAVLGDSIYNGVMDNAIGAAALLELARAFSEMPEKPKRSIIFLLTTGEEKGALGAMYYADNPAVPLYRTIANINIDGLAFIDEIKSVIGIGSEYSTLEKFLSDAAQKNGLFVTDIPESFNREEGFNLSDQIAFANAGIPSMLVVDGPDFVHLTKEDGLARLLDYGMRKYHTPFDDLGQEMDLNASALHLRVIFTLCYDLAQSDSEPEWKAGATYSNERLRTRAEKR